ncbi:MAG: sigma-70 family RNA polymerase sigma factor [Marinoscillum sp.]|uniref:RNA polymerase sigma factor n=1 Tax=Marinoscillum sp. TaxID=2024838 RepID=UPI0032F913E3
MTGSSNHIDLKEEKRWIELSQEDIQNFRPLYERYYASIFRYIFRRTDDEDLTADLCSQTFLKAITNIKKFRWQGKPLASWLFTIAGNEIKKHFRDQKEIFVIEIDKFSELPEFKPEWRHLTQDRMIALLNVLDEKELRIIELKYFEESTFMEMAVILGLKESTIKMKLYRLLKKLKLQLETHDTVRL